MEINLLAPVKLTPELAMESVRIVEQNQGSGLRQLSEKVKERLGAYYVTLCSSVSDAYRNVLTALAAGEGEAVFVPSFTAPLFVSTLRQSGATAIMVDCDDATWCMSAAKLERAVERCKKNGELYPRAVVVSDTMGTPFDYEKLKSVCDKHGLILIEDASTAIGAYYGDRAAGSLGDVSVLGFSRNMHPSGFSEGAAIVTNDGQIAKSIRLVSAGGMHTTNAQTGACEAVRLGTQCDMDELTAALILSQWDEIDSRADRRREISEQYKKALENSQVKLQKMAPAVKPSRPFFALRAPDAESAARIVLALREKGIMASAMFSKPLCKHAAFRYLDCSESMVPIGSAICTNLVLLPSHSTMTDDEISYVCENIRSICV